MDADEKHDCPEVQQPGGTLTWKRGIEVPMLLVSNPAAVKLCQAIIDGRIEELPSIDVTEAVAVQIYRLVVVSIAI